MLMKIGFATRWNPADKKSWSGTGYYTFNEIKKYGEVEVFYYKWPWYVREWCTMQKSLNRQLFKKNTSVEYLRFYAKYFSKQLEKDLRRRPVDVLFVPSSPQLIAYADINVPIIYMSDATFELLGGYYDYFSGLAGYNIKQGIELDKLAINKSAHCIMASEWAARFIINRYHKNKTEVSVLPMGANFDKPPAGQVNITKTGNKCQLLFLAVEWKRKGGDIALDTFRTLQQKGMDVSLYIIGCVPPHNMSNEKDIINIPFLNKNNKEEFEQLEKIFSSTDFLLMPTRAEAAGLVFCEASACGIPSITTDTGGVTTYVKNDINGYTLPLHAVASDYASVIENVFNNKEKYAALKKSSRNYFEEKLNWDAWGKKFTEIAERLVKHSSPLQKNKD